MNRMTTKVIKATTLGENCGTCIQFEIYSGRCGVYAECCNQDVEWDQYGNPKRGATLPIGMSVCPNWNDKYNDIFNHSPN